MKKILSLALTLLMVSASSLSIVAAVYTSAGTMNGDYTGESLVPAVDVEVYRINMPDGSTTIPFILNPYGVELDNTNGPWISRDGDTSQINSAPVWIRSNTQSGVSVGVNDAKLIISSGITVATKPITGTSTTKSVFVYLDMETVAESSASIPDIPEFSSYTSGSNQLALTETANAKTAVLATLNPVETSGQYQWACLRACGNASHKFEDSDMAWGSTDSVDVAYTLSFSNAKVEVE